MYGVREPSLPKGVAMTKWEGLVPSLNYEFVATERVRSATATNRIAIALLTGSILISVSCHVWLAALAERAKPRTVEAN